MGKKAKIGKKRRDKFYHLAKETGYRARSAFKLIQLNRKFNFLQESRVLIDLCAAPGGWLQVASNHMPVSSVIIGVDLVKIKPIHNVITLQADITTPKCRQLLQKELKTWKVDCVLNDGAPNVGTAWLQDAFTQAELTLSALKLASEFLKPGGTFVTKVFRSRDYQSLLNTFQQLFKKVHATKPQASRTESAEIFVVCQGYKLIKKPDPKLLDPKFVFEEHSTTDKPTPVSLQKIQKPPKSAEGYGDYQNTLFQSSSVLDFVTSDDHMTILGSVHQLIFDKPSDVFAKHPETTNEIKEYCQDIKVLGLKELKLLIKWREKMRVFLDSVKDSDDEHEVQPNTEDNGEDALLTEVDKKVEELKREEKAELKNALKRKKKMLKKASERTKVQKETHCEVEELIADKSKTFSLKSITSHKQLQKLDEGVVYSDSEEEQLEPQLPIDPLAQEASDESEEEIEEEDPPLEWESSNDGESSDGLEEREKDDSNPLLVKLAGNTSSRGNGGRSTRSVDKWFSNPAFKGLMADDDEEMELEAALGTYSSNRKDGGIIDKKKNNKKLTKDNDVEDKEEATTTGDGSAVVKTKKKNGFEIVPIEEVSSVPPRKVRKLDPEGLALGSLLVTSKKKRNDLIDSAYNRWSNNDDDLLPDWFVQDENKYCQKQLPVTKEMVDEYRKRLKEINARPIKKIAEAKARKKQRSLKKLEGIRKRAQVICDTVDVTDHEKAHQIKNMYKKAGLLSQKKEDVKYVVAKKFGGKRPKRPPGVSGKYKIVDPRMKKDKRNSNSGNKKKEQQKKRKKMNRKTKR